MYRFFFGFGFNVRFNVRFSVRYRVGVEFGFSKYPFYSKKPVFLVISCGMLKLLLSSGQCSIQGQFMGFNRNFRFLMDIGGNLASVEFSGIFWLVESGGFLVYGVGIGGILMSVDFGGNSGLVESGGFFVCGVGIRGIFMFWFRVAVRGNT